MGDIASESGSALGGQGSSLPNELFHPLADELLDIAARLRNAATFSAPELVPAQSGQARPERPAANLLGLARKAYSLRRRRSAIFGNAELFGEPAWDILLDLYIAHAEGKDVSVSSACIGSAAPATTGLRWLGVLADEGLIQRESDPADNRRVMVRLTAAGIAAMEQYFSEADSTG